MTTKLIPVWAGNFKADGGAIFGVIPKVLWKKEMPCDSDNFVELTMRCLLVDRGYRRILIETGTVFDGYTPGQMIPFIRYKGKTVVYTADLIPTAAHIPVLWIASYDIYPVTTMEEKESFIKEVAEKEYILFFEHDNYTECATVKWDGKRSSVNEKFTLDVIR